MRTTFTASQILAEYKWPTRVEDKSSSLSPPVFPSLISVTS